MENLAHKYLSTKELSDILGLNPCTLRCWRMRKQGPPWVKIGRVARYAVSAVNAWIEKQQKG